MKYSASLYAKAFISLLESHPRQQQVLTIGLFNTIQKAGDSGHIGKVVEEIERIILKKQGRKKVVVASARPLENKVLKEIESQFLRGTVFETKTQPELLAGLQVTVDGEQIIDNSLRRKLRLLFNGV